MSSLTNRTRPSCSWARAASTGSTAWHGPHHGAQKSTTTGMSACSTSASKLASVTASTACRLQASGERPEPEKRHLPDRLEHDRTAHLRAAVHAVDEGDRHLFDPESGAQRAVGGLDLEGVAAGVDRVEVERLEHVAPEALEAAGQVAHADTEQHACVERAAGRHDAP